MANLIGQIPKGFSAIFKALGPVFSLILIILVIGASLLIYDRIKTAEEIKLGNTLSEKLDVEAECSPPLKNQNEKFDFKFTFINNNSQSIFLDSMRIDEGLLGEDQGFVILLSTEPSSTINTDKSEVYLFDFASPVEIQANSKEVVTLKLQAADQKSAKAKPNTLVTYAGEVSFQLSPEMRSSASCKARVRYAD